jgi:hypothetical protein
MGKGYVLIMTCRNFRQNRRRRKGQIKQRCIMCNDIFYKVKKSMYCTKKCQNELYRLQRIIINGAETIIRARRRIDEADKKIKKIDKEKELRRDKAYNILIDIDE